MKLIPLSQTGKHKGLYFAQVDDEDYDYLMQWKWSVKISSNTNYAMCYAYKDKGVRKMYQMHVLIMKNINPTLEIDHIDHNGLNNQKYNLRLCTHQQNIANNKTRKGIYTSIFRGVSIIKQKGKYKSCISINNKNIFLGYFPLNPDGELAAAKKYDERAIIENGEFAILNFPITKI